MAGRSFTEADLAVGDWIRYREPRGGLERIAEIRSFYPFGKDGMIVDTTLGHVPPLGLILEVRKHVCDRAGTPQRVVDLSRAVSSISRQPTCSVCGKPQVFSA